MGDKEVIFVESHMPIDEHEAIERQMDTLFKDVGSILLQNPHSLLGKV